MSEEISIKQEEGEDQGRYSLFVDGESIGELTYTRRSPGKIIANHTFVNPDERRKGMARMLVDRLADDAREAGSKISPSCPYVRWVFEENEEEFGDVWDR